jgi:amino acid adenylation domain-containing protein
VPVAAGILPNAFVNIFVLEYGDPRSLDFVAEHARELAAVLVEPVQSRNPELQPRDFLHQLRRVTEDNVVALIFDEIVTGFRCHPGGAQAHFGVRADIATYGKVLGGGMPIGVVAGTSHFMDALDGGAWRYGDSSGPSRGATYLAGTFVRHPLAIAAADAVVRRLNAEGPALQETLNERTANLAGRLQQLLADSDLPLRLGHFASLMFLRPTEQGSLASLLFYHLRARGIHIWEGRPAFLSTAHTDQDLATIESAFAASLAELTGRAVVAVNRPTSAPGRLTLPMTPAQTDLWIASSLGTGASLSYTLAFLIHARGPLNLEALRRSLQEVVDRHEALRTTFDAYGRTQSIRDQMPIDVPLEDISTRPPSGARSALAEMVAQSVRRPFDLENGPLFRAQVIKLAAEHHALLLTAHHLVLDGGSFGVLLGELGSLYTAHLAGRPASLPTPLATRTYTRLEQEQRSPAEVAANREYWLKQLAQLPDPLELPATRPRPAVRSYRAATETFVLDRESVARLRRACAQLGCGLMHLLLASHSVLVHRLSASDDFVVGVPATSSLSDAGLRITRDLSLVGDHVNVLPVRMRHLPEQTFEEHVRSVKDLLISGYEHQNFTSPELVRELKVRRDAGHVPLIPVVFNFERAATLALEGVETEVVVPPRAFDFYDLAVNIIESPHELRVSVMFSTDLFEAEVVRAWLAAWRVLLDGAVAAPGLRVADLPLLLPQEQQAILERWNATGCALSTECIHRQIANQARQTPDAIAVEPLTYRELLDRTNRLASRLREAGVGPDQIVGLCAERSPQLVVGLLAILQAGGAYLPLDPSLPDERLRFMLEDAGGTLIVTESHLRDRFGTTAPVIDLDRPLPDLSTDGRCLDSDVGPGHLAYVIYTSGSTGRPKSVAVEHRALANNLRALQREIDLGAEDVLLAVTTMAFDIAALELLLPLMVGARVTLATDQTVRDGRELLRALNTTGATVMQATPVTWRMLLDAGWDGEPRLKVLCGGEALLPGLAQELRARSEQVWNLYGPTEATIWCSSHRVTREDAVVPIGRPLANTRMYILGPRGEPVPAGVPGDLFIGGAGLARGYWRRPDLTSERFLVRPIGGEAAVRVYQTGDRARHRPDGVIEFLGRGDDQIKLRGFRIELGEVEAALSEHPGVRHGVALLREDTPGDKRLVAYVAPHVGAKLEQGELRAFLRLRLPEYMLPSQCVVLAALPLSPSGKVDRAALPEPDGGREPGSGHVPPTDPLEARLVRLWEKVLKVRPVGLRDNFFDLGGHSLLALRMFRELEREFGSTVTVAALFGAPTIEQLAPLFRSGRRSTRWSSLTAIQPGGRNIPFFCVHADSGHVFLYRDLASQLGREQPVYGFESRGLDGITAPVATVEEMAAHYIEEMREVAPKGPYCLGGFCFGAYIALEMAHRLQAEGEEVPLLVSFNTDGEWKAMHNAVDSARMHWRYMTGSSTRAALGYAIDRTAYRLTRVAGAVARGRASWARVRNRPLSPSLRHAVIAELNLAAVQSYVPRPYEGTLVYFQGSEDRAKSPEPFWGKLVSRVETHVVHGRFIEILREPGVRQVAEQLRSCLEAHSRRRLVGGPLPAES